MADGRVRDDQALVSIRDQPSALSSGVVAPPLLVGGSESIQWEVVWLTRSVRGFLFR